MHKGSCALSKGMDTIPHISNLEGSCQCEEGPEVHTGGVSQSFLMATIKIPWTVWLKQTSLSHSSGGWQVQGQGSDRFRVWGRPTFWFTDNCLLTVPPYGRRGKGALQGPFIRALTPFLRAPPASWPHHFSKSSLPNTITLRIRFQRMNFVGGTNIHLWEGRTSLHWAGLFHRLQHIQHPWPCL